MKRLFLALAIIALGIDINAQSIKVYKNGDVITTYQVSDIDSLVFVQDEESEDDSEFCKFKAKFYYSPVTDIQVLNIACTSLGEFCTITDQLGQTNYIVSNLNNTNYIAKTEAEKYAGGYFLGLSGLIIGTPSLPDISSDSQIVCYDLSCPNCYSNYSIVKKMEIQSSGVAYCSKCLRKYDLNYKGIITNGESGISLFKYRCKYDTSLHSVLVDNDGLESEATLINSYISTENINVISFEEFVNADYSTDVENNQYVKLDDCGLYLQIVNEGAGSKMSDDGSYTLICRFTENNLQNGSELSNRTLQYAAIPEYLRVIKSGDSLSGKYDLTSTTGSLMYAAYGDENIPQGWCEALKYIKIGRQTSADIPISKVRLIVPSAYGHKDSKEKLYPCFYELTFQESSSSITY